MITSAFQQPMSRLLHNRILVVDDTALNRELIVNYLQTAGFRHIETASDGLEAMNKIGQSPPDLLILDLIMPQLSGLEVIQQLRSTPQTQQLPILVQTIISDPEQRIEAWKYGATDIVTKPIHRSELLARVKVHLENAFLIRELANYHDISQQDISQALEMQKTLLPSQEILRYIEKRDHLEINSLFIPSRFLSGDIWGLIDAGPGMIIVWICDFSGKGIRAALHTFRLHTLINEFKHLAENPHELICSLNTKLIEFIPVGQFSTFMVGVIDIENDLFRYATASATHPVIYYPNSNSYIVGDGSGLPIGIVKNTDYPIRTLAFPKGASLIMYSDLFWEERAIPGISLAPESLPRFIKELKGRKMVDVIKQQIDLLGEPNFTDDLTLVEIHRLTS
jgi:phosphoserine phosphatase RsbU/P